MKEKKSMTKSKKIKKSRLKGKIKKQNKNS
jgi:hypothetical protein